VEAYERAKAQDLIAGVCDLHGCRAVVTDTVEAEGFEIDGTAHELNVAGLVDEGYELHTV